MKEPDISLPRGVRVLQRLNLAIAAWLVLLLLMLIPGGWLLIRLLAGVEGVDTATERGFIRSWILIFSFFCLLDLGLLFFGTRKLSEVDGRCRKLLLTVYCHQFVLMPAAGLIAGFTGIYFLTRDKESCEVLEENAAQEMRAGFAAGGLTLALLLFAAVLFVSRSGAVLQNYESKLHEERNKQEAADLAQSQFREGLPSGSVYDNQTGNVYF